MGAGIIVNQLENVSLNCKNVLPFVVVDNWIYKNFKKCNKKINIFLSSIFTINFFITNIYKFLKLTWTL